MNPADEGASRGTVRRVAEIVEARDVTDPLQNGWAMDYLVRRGDGQELRVEMRCWDRAREAAERAGNATALEAMADRAPPQRSSGRSSRSRLQHVGPCWSRSGSTLPTGEICASASATSG